MASRAITALFDDYEAAAGAVDRIEAEGVPHADISIAALRAPEERGGAPAGGDQARTAGTGAAFGTVIGGGAGLLAGLGIVAVPGLGPVLAAGWLATALTGAGVGAAAGGLLGALTGAGMSDADAETYAEGVRRGGTLLTVQAAGARAARVLEIVKSAGAVDLDARAQSWSNEGWAATRTEPKPRSRNLPAELDPPPSEEEDFRPEPDGLEPHAEPRLSMDPMESPTTRQRPGEIR